MLLYNKINEKAYDASCKCADKVYNISLSPRFIINVFISTKQMI